jgi:hypothetical protein
VEGEEEEERGKGGEERRRKEGGKRKREEREEEGREGEMDRWRKKKGKKGKRPKEGRKKIEMNTPACNLFLSSVHSILLKRHRFTGPPPPTPPPRFTKEGRWAPLVAVAVCLPMTGLPFGTTFPKNHRQSPASWQGPPAAPQVPIFRILCRRPPATMLRRERAVTLESSSSPLPLRFTKQSW